MDLLEFIHQSNKTIDPDQLTDAFLEFLSGHGLDRFVMSEMSHDTTQDKEENHGIVVNYSMDFMSHYIENNYIDHDPVYQRALVTPQPFAWEEAEKQDTSQLGQKVMNEAREAGLYNGIGLSIHRPFGRIIGMGFASSEKNVEFSPDTTSVVYAAANQFFMVYADLMKLSNMGLSDQVNLTEREREVLLWLSRGNSKSKVADKMCVSESTVKRHCEHIFFKLKVNNVTLAVFKAVRMGLIKPY